MATPTYQERLESALIALNALIERGAEIPDVDWTVANSHRVRLQDLLEAYDEQ